MPIFEYQCTSCRHEFETLVRTGDTPACPTCASQALTKLISLPAIKSESTHALASSVRTLLSTPLLPGEDPTLLTGPDAAVDCRLTGAELVDLLLATVPV